jgi:hypothetical protein
MAKNIADTFQDLPWMMASSLEDHQQLQIAGNKFKGTN